MAIRIVSLSMSPKAVLDLIMEGIEGDLVHRTLYNLGKKRAVGSIIFERFYPRENHQRMLVIEVENIKGGTNGTIITSSNPEEWRYQLDWDMEDNFMNEVMDLLDEYIIEEEEG